MRLLYRLGILRPKCRHCGRRYIGYPTNFPTCVPCFLRKCEEFETRTGMCVGYGPVSREVFKDDD